MVQPSVKNKRTVERDRILVVCRKDSNVQVAVPALKESGLTVDATESVYKAVALHAREPYRLIVIETAGIDGNDSSVFEVLREESLDVYILAIIPANRRDAVVDILKAGVDTYALEPVYVQELVALVTNAITRKPAAVEKSARDDKLRSLGRFARGIAHSVNNPLTTLSGWLQIMLSDMAANDPRRNTLIVMNQETERVAAVVRDLLAFAGYPSPNRSEVNLNHLIDKIVMELENSAEFRTVLFTKHLTPGLGTVHADREQLAEACSTIIRFSAGRSATGDGVDIATYPANGSIHIEVAHSGDPLNKETVEHLFDPFSALFDDDGLSGLDAGGLSELAMPVSYGIIRGLGGTLNITTDDAKGSSFVISLPASTSGISKQ